MSEPPDFDEDGDAFAFADFDEESDTPRRGLALQPEYESDAVDQEEVDSARQ